MFGNRRAKPEPGIKFLPPFYSLLPALSILAIERLRRVFRALDQAREYLWVWNWGLEGFENFGVNTRDEGYGFVWILV